MARNETVFTDYDSKVESDAENIVSEKWDDVRQGAMDGDFTKRKTVMELLDDDGYIHQHLDQEIDLYEAADILQQCTNEETDSGYWMNHEDPVKAVGAKAFYSFLNDVREEVKSQFETKLEELKEEQETFLEEQLNKELSEQQHYLEALEAEIKILEDQDAEFEGHVPDITDKIDEKEQIIEKVKEKIESLEEKISDQETVIDNIQDAIDSL